MDFCQFFGLWDREVSRDLKLWGGGPIDRNLRKGKK